MDLKFLTVDSIEEIHVEVTNLCNAACPMCARNRNGYGLTDNPGWGHWHSGDEHLVFSKELTNLKTVSFCGTHGDPLAHPFLPDVVKLCKERGLQVVIFTNGSLRSSSWWNKLLAYLDKDDKIVFGIDGIETNHLYRRNTDIKKILNNVKLAVDSRIIVQWDFLAFKHNEHELEKCKDTAKELGVKKFRIRKTARFSDNKFEVKNSNNETAYYLEPPTDTSLRHPDFEKIKELYSSIPTEYNITCLYKEAKKIYINSRLEVFPCCYISDVNEKMQLNIDETVLQVPLADMSLRNKSWSDILSIPFYKEELLKSFKSNNTLKRCIFTCGVVDRETNQNMIVKQHE